MPYPVFVDGRSLWTTVRLNGELRLLEDGPNRIAIEEGRSRLGTAFFATIAALALINFALPWATFAARMLTLSALAPQISPRTGLNWIYAG